MAANLDLRPIVPAQDAVMFYKIFLQLVQVLENLNTLAKNEVHFKCASICKVKRLKRCLIKFKITLCIEKHTKN